MNETIKYEPPQISAVTFLLKTAAGFGAGVVANLILLLLFLLTSSILQPVLTADSFSREMNPVFVFTLIAIIFLTSLAGNLIGPLLFGLIQREKYQHRSTSLTHIFTLNVIVLVLLIPLYIIAISMESSNLVTSIAGLHLIMGTLASLIIFEVISNPNYSLIGIYGTLFAMLAGIALNFLVFELSYGNWTVLMFAAMPILWICIGFVSALLEAAYHVIYSTTGRDFLLTTVEYGTDYGIQEPKPEDQPEKQEAKDESGTDFLRHQ